MGTTIVEEKRLLNTLTLFLVQYTVHFCFVLRLNISLGEEKKLDSLQIIAKCTLEKNECLPVVPLKTQKNK